MIRQNSGLFHSSLYTLFSQYSSSSYDPSGHCKGVVRFNLPEPIKLKWDILPEVGHPSFIRSYFKK